MLIKPGVFFFTEPSQKVNKQRIFQFDCLQEQFSALNHVDFDFYAQKQIKLGDDLFSFSETMPLSVTKYQGLSQVSYNKPLSQPIHKLNIAAASHKRVDFALAALSMDFKIYITGGLIDDQPSPSVIVFDTERDIFTQTVDMNYARAGHSSTSSGSKVYVFGGQADCGETDSIEVLETKREDAIWSIITSPLFTQR